MVGARVWEKRGLGSWYLMGTVLVIQDEKSSGDLFVMVCSNMNVLNVTVKVAQLCPTLATPWTVQSIEFCRPEYWSG